MSDPMLSDPSDDVEPDGSYTEVVDEWLERAAGFVMVRPWMLHDVLGSHATVSGEGLRLYLAIAQHARRRDRTAWPSNRRLAALMQASARSVQRWLGDITAAGWVVVTHVAGRAKDGSPMTIRRITIPEHRAVTAQRPPCPGAHDTPVMPPATHVSPKPDESELDELNHIRMGEGVTVTEEPRTPSRGIPVESPDPAASLWGAIQETLAVEGVGVRGAPAPAHQAVYAIFRRPGFAPNPALVVAVLARDARKWAARAKDARATGDPDPWRYTPSLVKWITERRWEIVESPEPPAPAPTVSVPGVSRRELLAREEDQRRRREATARARGTPLVDLPDMDAPRPIGDAVREITRRKGPPS